MSIIKTKEKKCKGTGKAKGHGCGYNTMVRHYGLCTGCYRAWLLNTPEGQEKVFKSTLRASVKVKTDKRKEFKELKEQHKSIAKLIQEARTPFQQWIRKRDANLKCVSCGKDSETWDAGHYYKAEIYTGLIFDERNVNKQCVYCNQWLDGNEGNYRHRLVSKFGSDWMFKLDEDAIKLKSYKFTRDELISIKKKYQEKLKS